MEEWLVDTVMALFEEANTVIRTSAGNSNSFHVTVGVHPGSVLSPLLFANRDGCGDRNHAKRSTMGSPIHRRPGPDGR